MGAAVPQASLAPLATSRRPARVACMPELTQGLAQGRAGAGRPGRRRRRPASRRAGCRTASARRARARPRAGTAARPPRALRPPPAQPACPSRARGAARSAQPAASGRRLALEGPHRQRTGSLLGTSGFQLCLCTLCTQCAQLAMPHGACGSPCTTPGALLQPSVAAGHRAPGRARPGAHGVRRRVEERGVQQRGVLRPQAAARQQRRQLPPDLRARSGPVTAPHVRQPTKAVTRRSMERDARGASGGRGATAACPPEHEQRCLPTNTPPPARSPSECCAWDLQGKPERVLLSRTAPLTHCS